jgi:DNA polymerase II large subunit
MKLENILSMIGEFRMGTEKLNEINSKPQTKDEIKLACTDEMNQYLSQLKTQAEHCYLLAREARNKGMDPTLEPEIIMTEDLAARVEGLVGPEGIATRIREVAKEVSSREMLSLTIAQELVKELSKKNRQQAVEQAVRTGLAILTEGVLVAPIEGIAKVDIEKNPDGTEFISLFFAGPIRSAGGTGQAMSVLIADMVRRAMDMDRYKPLQAEIERMKEEVSLYHRRMHLQYEPTPHEIELLVNSCPVCIDGEGTEDEEVSGYRNIPRIKTAKIRGGACLVLAEGMCLKAAKLQKIVKQLGIDGWEFIDSIANKTLKKGTENKSEKTKTGIQNDEFDQDVDGELTEELDEDFDQKPDFNLDNVPSSDEPRVKPLKKYIRDSLAGRPVFSNPSQKGGFRLRYGRARTTGLAALAMNPVTMYLLGEFLAIGTQLKIERPGKAGVTTSCDQLEGPIVVLEDQTLTQINTMQECKEYRDRVERIIDLGEILIPFGEFVENNHELVPGAFDILWWQNELEDKLVNRSNDSEGKLNNEMYQKYLKTDVPNAIEGFEISRKFSIPLHPAYNLFWHDFTTAAILKLRQYIHEHGKFDGEVLFLSDNKEIREIITELCVFHELETTKDLIKIKFHAYTILQCLGLDDELNYKLGSTENTIKISGETVELQNLEVLDLVSKLSGVDVKARAPTRIGASMGRPEKAKERKMKPAVHALFPLGNSGGTQRLIKTAAENSKISIEAGLRRCTKCGNQTILTFCNCGGHSVSIMKNGNMRMPENIFKKDIPIKEMVSTAQRRLNLPSMPDVKGVIGLISQNKTPEPLEKGILRAKHGVYVFKDGTVRFDMTDVPLTHFKPAEIGTSIEKLHDLGYNRDHKGELLTDPDQIVELKPQDIVPSKSCGEYLLKVSKFIDELLVKFYGMESFYNAATSSDLLGQIVMGLSPHTSGAVLGRLVGYTQSQVGYAHPFYHAAKRRNCDGDEDCVMLLLDGLLNFSQEYLPGTRGGYMDAPLVFMTYINPNEIDKEAQNIDIASRYPLEFYRAAENYAKPKELENVIETVGDRIGTCGQFEGFGFTFDTGDINIGPAKTAYTRLDSMIDKMEAQLKLADQIRAVDAGFVAARVIESHFLPDMIGNLRSFSKQTFRCPKCRAKYRRIPLRGVCTHEKGDGNICGNNLIMTVHKGGVTKYLKISKEIAVRYNVPKYTHQRILLNEKAIDSTFENDKVKKFTLDEFM